MLKIPILRGIYADAVAEFVDSYPVNREPVVINTGLSEGFLRTSPGITGIGTGPGVDRGGINWNGTCYRVLGTTLGSVSASGVFTELGDVGGGGQCSFDYSFVNLIINSGTRLYYWNNSEFLRQVTDSDLGIVIDALWVDGYTMTTDGAFLVVTELDDPMAVSPLKYGSSEVDPDPILGLIKVRDEVAAINRDSIEFFQNIGGNGFPYVRNPGAMIPCGAVGTHAKTPFLGSFAFVGSARNEALGVYVAGSGDADKISTRQIDRLLNALTAEEQAAITMDTMVYEDEQRLRIHLPTLTLVFYTQASAAAGEKIWSILASGLDASEGYRGRSAVLAYGKFIVADANGNIGVIDKAVATQFGDVAGWRIDTALLFNDAGSGIVGSVELTGIAGVAPIGADPRAFLSYTIDGRTWGQEYAIATGSSGQRAKRMQWRKSRRFDRWLGMRFRGADGGMATFARLDADVEALS